MKYLFLLFLSFSSLAFNYSSIKTPYENQVLSTDTFKRELALWISLGMIFYANDEPIQSFIREGKSKHQFLRDLSPEVERFGKSDLYLGVGLMSLSGWMFGKQRVLDAGLLSLGSLLLSGTVTTGIKHMMGRHRPRVGSGAYRYEFGFRTRNNDYHSMSSGDASNAFSVASVMDSVYDDKPWVGYLSYTIATLVAANRVFNNAHWPTDVLLGAIIGHYSGKKMSSMFLDREKKNKSRWILMPRMSHRQDLSQYSLSFTYNF